VRRKTRTLEEIERMQSKAVRFLRGVVGDSDKADEFEAMSPEEYAEHKRITILDNPTTVITKRSNIMAAVAGTTKAELEQALDSIEEILDDALDPELTREDVVAKVKQAYDIACGDDSNDDSDDDSDDSDDDDTEN
jgi:hypothetical protein